MEGEVVTHEWACRIGDNNTVFQPELFAILRTLEWIASTTSQNLTKIYSDSLSSLQAIHTHKTKHPMVPQVKLQLKDLARKVVLGHAKARIGIPGNERADKLVKDATERPSVEYSLPVPPSFIRRILKSKIIPQWQDHWNYSESGRHTHKSYSKSLP